jgi:hypothetical protein
MRTPAASLLVLILGCHAGAEVPPAASLPCFPGAYYRKAVSSADVWTGIEGTVTLPAITFDESRRNPKKPGQYLDNPSVYIGGRAGEQEIDAGVSWEVIRERDGSVSNARKAFRPFWRNKGWHAAPADPALYFYPGDTIRLRIETPATNKLTLTVQLVERGEEGKRASAGLQPSTRPAREPLKVEFDAFGFGPGKAQQFKRVNAIDQVGREGKDVDATRTQATGAVWKEAFLFRGVVKLPFAPGRFTDMRCPDSKHFNVEPLDGGGERIDIHGSP